VVLRCEGNTSVLLVDDPRHELNGESISAVWKEFHFRDGQPVSLK
jgi:hypothetical protein